MLIDWLKRSRPEVPPTGDAVAGENPDVVDEPGEGAIDPVSDVLRRTDVWFAYRVDELEKVANELAASHAAVGQPRHDLTPSGPLHMEVVLANRATEVLHNWADRVRVRMHGAMEREVEALGACVSEGREAVANATSSRMALDAAREHLDAERNRSATSREEQRSATIAIERHLPLGLAFALLVLLVVADLFANLPVFVELLPTDAQASNALRQWSAQQLSAGLTAAYGVRNLWYSVATHPEPAILALSVIIFFLLLGHKLGTYMRRLVALWSATGIGTHWKEAVLPAVLAAAGIGLTVTFLFGARAAIKPLTEQRFQVAEERVREITTSISQIEARREEVPETLFEQRAAAEQELKYRRDRRDYGSTLAAVNTPILLLNLVLVLAATVIGYATAQGRFSNLSTVNERDPVIRLEGEIAAVRSQLAERRTRAYEVLRRAEKVVIRVEHLGRADVLKDFEAKKARVACAIPLFRSENARRRSLDVMDIVAFRSPADLPLPSFEDVNLRIETPVGVKELRSELEALSEALRQIDHDSRSDDERPGDGQKPSVIEPLSLIAGGR
jgi:hypothetical protein